MTASAVSKKQPVTLTEEQVIDLIKAGQKGRTLREYAQELKISVAYLNDIYWGRRSPGEKALQFFGIRKTRRVIVEYQK